MIEIGLRLDQVAGLESEPINKANYKSVGDDRLRECGATEEEIAFLGPHGDAKAPYGRRVELNALITADLVSMVENALTAHGIRKIVPDDDDLAAAWRAAKAHAEIAATVEKANEHAQRWQDEPAPDDLADQIRELLEADPTLSWDEALRRICGGM